MNTAYDKVKDLPFADGGKQRGVTEPIVFNLEKDGRTVTLIPAYEADHLPENLIRVLYDELIYVIDEGRTYPHHSVEDMTYEKFVSYWFIHFVGILLDGEYTLDLPNESYAYYKEKFLGNFFIKPNYIGRVSHICNAGFIVSHEKRGLSLGKEMGRKYLEIAPKLGFIYSVFNLVFETNVASLKIWDNLGFERIGYIKNAAVLKGEDKLVGAVMFGKDL